MEKPIITIVVPCFNEEKTIFKYYREINKIFDALPQYCFELIFVNDGSKDQTVSEILKLRERDPRIMLIDFSRNFGKEAALLAGLRQSSGDAVIVMDVDLQDPPELIPRMLEGWEKGYDIVYTKRKNRIGEPKVRSFFAKMFYRIINRMSNIEIVDGARDYRIMSRKAVESVLELNEKRRFSKGLFMWVGYDPHVIEYEYVERSGGETKWSFVGLVNYAIEGIISFSNFPLRFVSMIGIFTSSISFLFLMYVLIKNVIFRNPVAGWASLAAIIVFLGSVQLLVLGILGEYLGRIFDEVKNRPQYLIKNLYESNLPKKDVDKDFERGESGGEDL